MAANWWYRRGGLGAIMFDETAELERRGHAVIPFAAAHPANRPTPWARYFPPFTETADLGATLGSPLARLAAGGRLVWNRPAARGFAKLLAEAQPDVIHLHNTARQLSPSILRVARARRVPVVMSLHDYGLICPQSRLFRGEREACHAPNCTRGNVLHVVASRCVQGSLPASALAAVEHLVHRSLGLYIDRVALLMSPSQYLIDVLVDAGIPRQRLRHLPNAVPDAAPGQPTGSTPNSGYVLFAGRLALEKGLDVLLAVARMTPEIRYLVAGDGPMRDALEANRPTNLELVGALDSIALDRLRRDAVAVIAPSVWFENAPMTILEAMGAGRPVIASAIGGQPEMLAAGGGILVPAGDASATADAVRRLWTARGEGDAMGAAGRAAIAETHTIERHVDRLLELYQEVTAA